MDLGYIWYDDRYWSKILFSTILTPMRDLKVKITDFYVNIFCFCCGSLLLLVLAVCIYTLVQLLC